MDRRNAAILTQVPSGEERKIRRRWIVAASAIPLFGIVAAFGIAPGAQVDYIPTRTVVEQLPLPVFAAMGAESDEFWREERIQRGDTIANLLSRLQVRDPQAFEFLRTTRGTRSLYQLVPGRTVQARTTAEGRLLSLRYLNGGVALQVERDGDRLSVSEQPVSLEPRLEMKSGEIRTSLFAATDAMGLPDGVATQIAEIFGSEIDFHRDLRKGDRFSVVYELAYSNGEPARVGRVVAAEFVNNGKAHRAVWYQPADGSGGYYAPDGKNLRAAFLRSPLEFSRVTSGFSNSRYHPVLKEWRAHRGIDYGAPTGTRVRATADGVVQLAGRQNGYGNIVVIQHHGAYSTAYGHLSGFSRGLRKGSRVSQGDIIGFVGMTGLASGPHLHYEFRVNNEQRDPLRVALPTAQPIAPHQQASFDAHARPLGLRMELLRTTRLVRLD